MFLYRRGGAVIMEEQGKYRFFFFNLFCLIKKHLKNIYAFVITKNHNEK